MTSPTSSAAGVEGVRGQRAVEWRLVDAVAKPAQFAAAVQERAAQLAAGSDRPAGGKGVALTRLEREETADSLQAIRTSGSRSTAASARRPSPVKAPTGAQPAGRRRHRGGRRRLVAAGRCAASWTTPFLNLRTNELDIGTWLLKTEGEAEAVLASDAVMLAHKDHWLVRERIHRRAAPHAGTPGRVVAQPVRAGRGGLVLCRHAGGGWPLRPTAAYMLALPDDAARAPKLVLNEFNFGFYPMVNDQSRLRAPLL